MASTPPPQPGSLAAKLAARAMARAAQEVVAAARPPPPSPLTPSPPTTVAESPPACEWWRAVFFGCDVAVEHLTTEQWVYLIVIWVCYAALLSLFVVMFVMLIVELARECESDHTRTRRVHAELKRARQRSERPSVDDGDDHRGPSTAPYPPQTRRQQQLYRYADMLRGGSRWPPASGEGKGASASTLYHRVQSHGGTRRSGNRSVLKQWGCCSYCCITVPVIFKLSLDDDEAHAALDRAVERYEEAHREHVAEQARRSASPAARVPRMYGGGGGGGGGRGGVGDENGNGNGMGGVTIQVFDSKEAARQSMIRAMHATDVPRC